MSAEQKDEKLKPANDRGSNTGTGAKAASLGSEKNRSRRADNDPYIRNLFGIAALVIIGALLTMISAYLTGVISFDQDRATNIDEFTVARSVAYADTERTAGALSQLAIAQIANGQFIEAETTIQEAFALNSIDEERNQGPLFAYAKLANAQSNYEVAIQRYEQVMANLLADWTRVFESDIEPNWAQAFGIHPNYYESAIALSFLYRERGDYEKQLEVLDIAVEGMPTLADVFVYRGQARLAQGDNEGAIEDFNEALRFIPDDGDALRGLEQAGGTVNDGEE